MASSKSRQNQEKLLDMLIGLCNLSAIRWMAGKGGANRPRIRKINAVKAIAQQVVDYYQEHPLESVLLTRQAKVYQKYFFRQKMRKLRSKIESEDLSPDAKLRYQKLISGYQREYQALNRLKNQNAIATHLANYYAEDMVAELNPAFFTTFKLVAYRIFGNFARGIRLVQSDSAIEKLKAIIGSEPVFFVPNHVSNADHVPICLAINQSGHPQPLIAAGANLFRGTSTKVLPRLNAYKIRREHIGEGIGLLQTKWFHNPIYRRTHSEYLRFAWDHNEPCMFYIEGTRSRTGLIGAPKLGIMEEIIRYLRDTGRRAHFVPVSLSYSLVPEDTEIEAARQGKNISSKDLIAQLMDLDKACGQHKQAPIFLRFGDPIVATQDVDPKTFANDLVAQIKKQLVPAWTSRLASAIEMECAENGSQRFDPVLVKRRVINGSEFDGKDEQGVESALDIFKSKGFVAEDQDASSWRVIDADLIRQYANRIR